MSDITTAAAISIATGAVSTSLLSAFGIDPIAVGFGAAGAVCAQTLITKTGPMSRLWPTLCIMFASTLFGMAFGPYVTPKLVDRGSTEYQATLVMMSLVGGAFAQPLLSVLGTMAQRLLKRISGAQSNE